MSYDRSCFNKSGSQFGCMDRSDCPGRDDGPVAQETEIVDVLADLYSHDELLAADGFDKAIIGVDESTMRLIYSVRKCLTILAESMSEKDAMEYFEFNVSGSYVGAKTPIWCYDLQLS